MKTSLAAIIVQARELFRDRGYAGASMQDLAERVGIKKPSLYTRFPTKESLVPEVMAMTTRDVLDGQPGATQPWFERYAALLRRLAGLMAEHRRCVGLHLAYGIDEATPEAAEAVRAYFRGLREDIATILIERFDARTAHAMASDALARLEGATLWTVIDGDAEPMSRAVESLLAEARAPTA